MGFFVVWWFFLVWFFVVVVVCLFLFCFTGKLLNSTNQLECDIRTLDTYLLTPHFVACVRIISLCWELV